VGFHQVVAWGGKLEDWVVDELGRIELLETARLEVEEARDVVDDLEVDLEVEFEVEEDFEVDFKVDLEADALETVEDADLLATHADATDVDTE
jgi:hypothetical protein